MGWCDCKAGRERYIPSHGHLKLKEPINDPKNFQTKDMIARFLNKMEGTDKAMQEMKSYFSSLGQTLTSHMTSYQEIRDSIGAYFSSLESKAKDEGYQVTLW